MPDERSQAKLVHSQAGAHRLDAVVRSREELVSDREGFLDQIGEVLVDFGIGAILDDETLAPVGAPQPRADPGPQQDMGSIQRLRR